MPRVCRSDKGFTAIELLVVVAIVSSLAAMTLPISRSMIDDIRLRGDVHGVSNSIAQSKMMAAARFTRARLYVDLAAGNYRIEWWQRTGVPGWVADEGTVYLAERDQFSTGAANTPPPNSQPVVAQAQPCRNNVDAVIPDTACVVFNSRGIPIDQTGAPISTEVIYLTGASGVFGIVVSPTGQLQVWRTTVAANGAWRQQ